MKKEWNFRQVMAVSALLTVAALGAVVIYRVMVTGERELSFETIQRTEFDLSYGERESKLVIITEPSGINALGNTIPPAAQAELDHLNFRQYFVVAVFQGLKPTNMYGADIQRVTRSDGTVTIYTHFTQRDPQREAADISTSPFHVVKVQKTGLQGEFKFVLNADGAVLSQQTHFLP